MLKLTNITKKFKNNTILHNINFTIEKGEIISLVGSSGSGKSTLLHIAGLISPLNTGKIVIDNIDCTNMNDEERSAMRKKIGFIYQFHHLLPEFTALENLLLPQIISGANKKIAEQNALDLLERFGLIYLKDKKPQNLSGGENQRIAILRAFIKEPLLVLADEPTGNLDSANSQKIFDFILENSRLKGIASLIVTHNQELATKSDKILSIIDGKLLV